MEKFIERLLEEDIKFEKDVNNGLSDINIFDALCKGYFKKNM